MSTKAPIILAVDTSDLELAKEWIAHTSEFVQVFKLGLEFFLNFGPQGIRAITENTDAKIFLDLKLHDIPNTVAHAAASAALLKPFFLTVHASGGSEMIKAAVKAAPAVKITAVTILTSLSEDDVKNVGIEWAIQQAKELIDYKVPCLHFYSMGKSTAIQQIASKLF